MKSINIIFFASVCAMAVLFPSCDILDTKPEDFNSFNNFYKTEEQIYNTLATCYAPLATYNSYGGQLVFEAIMDDLMYWNWKSTPSSMINRTYGWNYNSSNADIEAMWNNLYFGIERSNLLLENIDGAEMDDELRETYRAEAAFLRAYYHFLLNVYWGDIPLKNKSLENVGAVNNPRTPTAEVTNFIITEMERAANSGKLIAADKYNHAARITQTAVEAILAKVCLKAAGYPLNLGEPMYRKALEYALRVKESGIHRLNPVYEQLFINQASDVYDNVYRESIWEAEFVGNSVTNPGRSTGYSMIGSRIGILSSESDNIGYGYGFVCVRLKLIDLYNDLNDTRKIRNVANFQYNASGTKSTISDVGSQFAGKWRRTDETLMPKHKNYTSTNVSIIRYADVLLMIAEAENELNGPTGIAYNALNEVRRRAGAITFTEDNDNRFASAEEFRQEVRDERARELCYEGIRKIDLVRWGIFLPEMQKAAEQAINDSRANARRDMMIEVAGKMSVRDLLFPIPQTELKLNNKMTQNPLW